MAVAQSSSVAHEHCDCCDLRTSTGICNTIILFPGLFHFLPCSQNESRLYLGWGHDCSIPDCCTVREGKHVNGNTSNKPTTPAALRPDVAIDHHQCSSPYQVVPHERGEGRKTERTDNINQSINSSVHSRERLTTHEIHAGISSLLAARTPTTSDTPTTPATPITRQKLQHQRHNSIPALSSHLPQPFPLAFHPRTQPNNCLVPVLLY